jgi:hypothetical protein
MWATNDCTHRKKKMTNGLYAEHGGIRNPPTRTNTKTYVHSRAHRNELRHSFHCLQTPCDHQQKRRSVLRMSAEFVSRFWHSSKVKKTQDDGRNSWPPCFSMAVAIRNRQKARTNAAQMQARKEKIADSTHSWKCLAPAWCVTQKSPKLGPECHVRTAAQLAVLSEANNISRRMGCLADFEFVHEPQNGERDKRHGDRSPRNRLVLDGPLVDCWLRHFCHVFFGSSALNFRTRRGCWAHDIRAAGEAIRQCLGIRCIRISACDGARSLGDSKDQEAQNLDADHADSLGRRDHR